MALFYPHEKSFPKHPSCMDFLAKTPYGTHGIAAVPCDISKNKAKNEWIRYKTQLEIPNLQ
jgi:hypothetical protein